jgi:hypothetical protein
MDDRPVFGVASKNMKPLEPRVDFSTSNNNKNLALAIYEVVQTLAPLPDSRYDVLHRWETKCSFHD